MRMWRKGMNGFQSFKFESSSVKSFEKRSKDYSYS